MNATEVSQSPSLDTPLLVTNAAAYHFANLTDLAGLRLRLQAYCRAAQLRGTILLSTEGVNLWRLMACCPNYGPSLDYRTSKPNSA
jgi:UPF0176 acylphosphatase like domain